MRPRAEGTSSAGGTPCAAVGPLRGDGVSVRGRASTVTGCLLEAAERAPGNGITIYTRHGMRDSASYPEILERALCLAAGFAEHEVASGERIGLLLPTSIEFFVAYFGSLFAGAVPVTLPVSVGAGPLAAGQAARLRGIAVDADLRFVVASRAAVEDSAAINGIARCLEVEPLCRRGRAPRALPNVAPSSRALIQYTSGSLSHPKGVVLSHRNIVANLHAIADEVAMGLADRINFWIPLFHDMGLIGSLAAIASHAQLSLCSPATFLLDPLGWLRQFGATGSTINASPHFFFRRLIEAYDHRRAEGLDLSRWRVAFNGSEMIRPGDLQAFVKTYAPHGFCASTLYPVYGLAEATLAASFPPYGRPPKCVGGVEVFGDACPPHWMARRFVSVGRGIGGTDIRLDERVADPGGAMALPLGVGEVLLRGPSVMQGYLNTPESESPALQDGWLCTGDLGFVHEGQLYLCGRRKEVLIVRGANYFPEDFERTAGSGPELTGLEVADCVAFSWDSDGQEQVGLALEIKRPRNDLAARLEALRERMVAEFHVEMNVLVFTPRTIPRTTSGKVRRHHLSQGVSTGSLVPLARALADNNCRWGP